MNKDLTNSAIDRQNILNNPYAIAEIEKAAGVRGIPFEGKTVLLKEQVAAFFEVTLRTVENYLEQNAKELALNGYEVLKGKRLKDLKLSIQALDVPETDFGNIIKTPQLAIFDFRAFLNLAMLVSESERAKLLRLYFSACKFHCFQDGNKRIAITSRLEILIKICSRK